MRVIERPKYAVAQVFADCLKVKRDKNLKARLQCVASEITAMSWA